MKRDFMLAYLLAAVVATGTLGYADGIASSGWGTLSNLAGALPDPLAQLAAPEQHDVMLYSSMLSPGVLLRMQSPTIQFFGDLEDYGAQGPTFFIVKTAAGTQAVLPNQPLDGAQLAAAWVVVSFQGAQGWENFDAPWFIALEKRPLQIELTQAGLKITFADSDTGHVFSMPLYGWHKLPQEQKDFCAEHQLPSSGIRPWEWKQSVPASVIERCDLWARIARAYPVGFQESFAVNPQTDEINFRYDYDWLITADDWQTAPLRFAPLSPALGLAWKVPGFPMQLSAEIHDPEYFTGFGPYVGAYDTNRVEISMQVLQYINELERMDKPEDPDANQAQALNWINAAVGRFSQDWRCQYDHGQRGNFCWNIVADVWYAKAIPFLEEPRKETVKHSMRIYMDNDVLNAWNYTPWHGQLILDGPGIGSWGGLGDSGKFASNVLQPVWAYAQYSGDWGLIRDRWDIIKRLFCTPEEMHWTGFGRVAIAELGDEAPPCSAYARLGWGVGDLDAYLLGCYTFARELIHHYIKQVGAEYFYERQPHRDLKPLAENVYLTDLWGSTVGWQIGGPLLTNPGQSENRWVRFHDPDTGRFYRDHLLKEVRAELDVYTNTIVRSGNYRYGLTLDEGHILPSLARLRSFLAGDSFEELSQLLPMTNYNRSFGPGKIAVSYAYLRAIGPVQYDRLVPKTMEPSPYVLGLQGVHMSLVQGVGANIKMRPFWHGWNMPKDPQGGKQAPQRNFGSISGDFGERIAGACGRQRLSYGCYQSWVDTTSKREIANLEEVIQAQENTPILFIGPFSNRWDSEILMAYPPEEDFQPQAQYDGIGRKVSWQPATLGAGRQLDLLQQAGAAEWPAGRKIAYVQQYVWSPESQDVYLKVGHSGGAQGWINEQRVISEHTTHGGFYANRISGLGRLQQGWNRLLVKSESPIGSKGFPMQFCITGLDDQPLPDLQFAAQPE